MADAPPPWEDSDESEGGGTAQCLEPITGTLYVPGQQPEDAAMLERGGAMQDGTDVPLRTGRHLHVHGVVTGRGSNPGENGTGAHGSKQGFLLERRARLVAASDA